MKKGNGTAKPRQSLHNSPLFFRFFELLWGQLPRRRLIAPGIHAGADVGRGAEVE